MATHTHQTAPTQFVSANGIRFAYRRFGKAGGVPLVFNMHFTGTMDHWDPAVTDGFARDREVILFNNAGVSRSSGEVPTSVEEMAVNAVAFIKALDLAQIDLLGFSLGGLISQEVAITAPRLIRRLVLVGTGPRGGEGMATLTPEAQAVFGGKYENPDHVWLGAFFTPSKRSQAAGHEYLTRFRLRTAGRDPEVSEKVAPAQLQALNSWGAPREKPYVFETNCAAHARGERQQRCARLLCEFIHPAAEHPRRTVNPVPGLQSWVAVPIPRAFCASRFHVPVRVNPLRTDTDSK
jgi:pimeloyl-ACP methyl ester carboxylesterase